MEPSGCDRWQHHRRKFSQAAFGVLIRAGHAALVELTVRRPQHLPPEILQAITEMCHWLSCALEKASQAWRDSAELMSESDPVRSALLDAAGALQDEAEWLVEDRGLEAPDGAPDRLLMAVDETFDLAGRVLRVLSTNDGEGVEEARKAATQVQNAANDAANHMRQKLEATEESNKSSS